MLDLDARVHLDEVEGAAAVEQELDRACVLVPHGARDPKRRVGQGAALSGVDGRRRALLEQLLTASLQGAFSLEEVHQVPVSVAEHLDLDVACFDEHLLDVHGVVTEGRARLHRRLADQIGELALVPGRADAATAAARRSLEQHRIADLGSRFERLVE